MHDNNDSWMEKGARVYAISRDSRFALAAFKEKEGFKHSILADMKGEVATKYGVWNETVGCAERATFVIGTDGKVAYAIHNGIPSVRDHSEVESHIS
ncbi:MAG: redoxin domain-containing protein [Dehalococcoidia bacterium]